MCHLNSADPVELSKSQACTAKFPDWYQHYFLPILMDQLYLKGWYFSLIDCTFTFYIFLLLEGGGERVEG